MDIRHFACSLAASLVIFAASAQTHPNLDAADIRSQQQQIRADAEARTGRYKHLSKATRSDLLRRQERVHTLLGDVRETTELDETRRIELFNNLEAISAIINFDEDQRMICERTKLVGTNRPTTVCRTVAQRRDEREGSQRDMGKRDLGCSEATMGPSGCQR